MTTAGRQALFFIGTVVGLCVVLALAMPHWELTPLIAAVLPAVAVVLVTVVSPGHGKGPAAWAGLGFRRPRIRDLLIAVGLSAAVSSTSFAIAAAIGVVDIPAISLSELGALLARGVIMTAVFTGVPLRGSRLAGLSAAATCDHDERTTRSSGDRCYPCHVPSAPAVDHYDLPERG